MRSATCPPAPRRIRSSTPASRSSPTPRRSRAAKRTTSRSPPRSVMPSPRCPLDLAALEASLVASRAADASLAVDVHTDLVFCARARRGVRRPRRLVRRLPRTADGAPRARRRRRRLTLRGHRGRPRSPDGHGLASPPARSVSPRARRVHARVHRASRQHRATRRVSCRLTPSLGFRKSTGHSRRFPAKCLRTRSG